MENVFEVALIGILSLFILGILAFLGINIINVHLYPVMKEIGNNSLPDNSSGITKSQYLSILDFVQDKFIWFLFIILAIPILYILVRLFYKRETTSYYT